MMLDKQGQDFIFKKIPSEFVINTRNGPETINFNKRYSNQFIDERNPSIVLTYITTGIVNYIYLNEVHKKVKYTQERFLSLENTDTYVLMLDCVNEIKDVYGYIDDNYELFVEDDYELTLNADMEYVIVFTGDIKPDLSTYFYVTYTHDKVAAHFGGEFQDKIQIDIYTTDITNEDGRFINGSIVAKEVTRQIKKFIRFGINEPTICVRNVGNTNDLTEISGEHFKYRYQFDIDVAYHDSYVEYYDTIKDVGLEFNVQQKGE